MSGDKLAHNETWWKGPKFLQLPDERWPSTDVFPPSDITESELIKHPAATIRMLVDTTECVSRQIDEVIDCSRYSSFNKLLRVTGLVLKFKNILLKRCQREAEPPHHLSGEDMNKAESSWILAIQAKAFSVELLHLQSRTKHVPPVRVSQFGLFLDSSGLLRCQGRINNAQLPTYSKQPILLPSSHPLVTLLVQQVHNDIKHSGTPDTLSTIREKYWILKGRQVVKKVLRLCVVCNKLEGVPYSSVAPPDLPTD